MDGTRPSDFDMTTTSLPRHRAASAASSARTPSDFGSGKDYTDLEGIITFRGNNYRSGANYGTADVKTAKLEVLWSVHHRRHRQSERHGLVDGQRLDRPASHRQVAGRPQADHEHQGHEEGRSRISPRSSIPAWTARSTSSTSRTAPTPGRPSCRRGGPFKGTASLYPDGTPMLFVGHGDGGPAGKQIGQGQALQPHRPEASSTRSAPSRTRPPTAAGTPTTRARLFDVESDTRHRARGERRPLHHQAEHQVRQGRPAPSPSTRTPRSRPTTPTRNTRTRART